MNASCNFELETIRRWCSQAAHLVWRLLLMRSHAKHRLRTDELSRFASNDSRWWIWGTIALFWLACTHVGTAQVASPAALSRVEVARQQSSLPEVSSVGQTAQGGRDVKAPRMAGDDEYGEQVILARRAEWEPWAVTIGSECFFTDNVALASEQALNDWYLRNGLTVQYTNRIAGDWFLTGAADSQYYLHDLYSELDFNFIRTDTGFMVRLPWLAETFVTAQHVWYRVSEQDLQSLAFQNHGVSLNAQKLWKISRGQQVFAGGGAEYSLYADPDPAQRHEYSGFVGYRLRLTEKVNLNSSYRLGWYVYPQLDRGDWNHVALVGASYDVASWARLSVSLSHTWNRSSVSFFDYDNLLTGVSVTLHVEF